jgi:hypothetical protein
MGKKTKSVKLDKINIIGLILNVILAGFNVYLLYSANEMTMENLRLQNMVSNFDPVMTVNSDYAFLGKPSEYYSYNNVTEQTTHYGYLNVSLQIITPHYGNVSIKLEYFNVGESVYLNQERRNETRVTFADEEQTEYGYVVVTGVNSINASLHLKARIYPNPQNIPSEALAVQFPLGRLFLEATLFDVQTQRTLTSEFSAGICVVLCQS